MKHNNHRGRAPIPIADRLEARFHRSEGCWEWTGSRTATGYGTLTIRVGEHVGSRAAHRLVYQYLVGEIPEGRELDHLCRNRACVRPDHLEVVTRAENVRRSYKWYASKHDDAPSGGPG